MTKQERLDFLKKYEDKYTQSLIKDINLAILNSDKWDFDLVKLCCFNSNYQNKITIFGIKEYINSNKFLIYYYSESNQSFSIADRSYDELKNYYILIIENKMAHETASTGGIQLTSEELKKLIIILNHKKIDDIIDYKKDDNA